jgi:hypothetical protein
MRPNTHSYFLTLFNSSSVFCVALITIIFFFLRFVLLLERWWLSASMNVHEYTQLSFAFS